MSNQNEKAALRADQATLMIYHEARLVELLEHVRKGSADFDAGALDALSWTKSSTRTRSPPTNSGSFAQSAVLRLLRGSACSSCGENAVRSRTGGKLDASADEARACAQRSTRAPPLRSRIRSRHDKTEWRMYRTMHFA